MKELSTHDISPLLTEIPDAPESLFLDGELPHRDTKLLAVVGARKYTEYGKQVCESLIAGLAGYPVSIVSGLALGIDSIAHRSALRAGLHTIAVPGSGLNEKVLYPSSHKRLAKEIREHGGALISEFEPLFKATPYSFPKRNRIMAGMSHAILVIEAQERSGTLITSRLAVEYNRDVCTIPHPIHSPTSKGPHMLIRLGATLIRDSNDILEVLSIPTTNTSVKILPDNLSPEEKKVLSMLDTPFRKDELFTTMNISTTEGNILISKLELKGLVRERLGILTKI